MSFFDALFGRKSAKADGPEDLRARLFEAAAENERLFAKLCRENRDAIVTAFATWTPVPSEVRSDKEATQRYVHGLISVARFFAETLGEPALLQRLMPAKGNPLVRWQEQLKKARELMDTLNYAAAATILDEALAGGRKLSGSGAEQYLPITLGFLGECHFQSGDAQRAAAPTREALDLCVEYGDAEGIAAYLGNIYEIHRYLGDSLAAATYAERLADAFDKLGNDGQAKWYRKQARLAASGEPLNRVIAMVHDSRYELDDVPAAISTRVTFVFERNRTTLKPAAELTRKGEALGSEGAHERALAAFRSAAAADPRDPHCRFLEGLTLLHLERPSEAVACYDACEARAPGWFVCRADRWLAQQIADGRLDHEAFLASRSLERQSLSPAERQELARGAIERYPSLAGLYLELGKALGTLGRRDEARTAYAEGLARAEEPDVKTRLLADLAATTDSDVERRRLLVEAVELRGNLVAAAMAQVLLRAARLPE